MTDKTTNSKAAVELKDTDLDEVAGGFTAPGDVAGVVSGPIPKGGKLISRGAKSSTKSDPLPPEQTTFNYEKVE